MNITTIVGARPQFIKAAAVSRAMSAADRDIVEHILHTGQHYDENMAKVFFTQLGIPQPKWNLEIHGGNHGAMTGKMLEQIEKVLIGDRPDLVLIYGDTNSTLAGALAAAKLQIPAAHVEAGMRSFRPDMPEEINRIAADRVSRILLCSSPTAVKNLKNEGMPASDSNGNALQEVHLVGDVMYDVLLHVQQSIMPSADVLRLRDEIGSVFSLATCHRAENTDSKDNLVQIFSALDEISRSEKVVLPLHPRTKQAMEKFGIRSNFIKFVDPLNYRDLLYLAGESRCVLTDSGGLQKEAWWLGKPCITMRDETEWCELVQYGCNILTGASREKITLAYTDSAQLPMNAPTDIFGSGDSAEKIVGILTSFAVKRP
ncbi:MAG: UDP-N-acetylglucosamine 2-epimerase (non-hydrolyzing) [Bdellovibrionales bacterium]|nr:UDP-N-acetylglucosamine 2-epimerase (non-hydrolyzing) [Bdellovibrionales bacterium]